MVLRHKGFETPRFVETGDDTTHPITQILQGAIVHARWANKILERCTLCSNHNKKISLDR
jgi:hypothetical protein